MSRDTQFTVVPLPENLGLTAAAPLAARLCQLSGAPLELDASRVERLGGLCLQVLLSASVTWAAANTPLTIRNPSSAFLEAWSLFGAPSLPARSETAA
jgi:chemotaxis protein CheX